MVLEIRARTGISTAGVSPHWAGEKEWLMPHEAQFRVTGVTKVPWGKYQQNMKTVVQLEEVV